MTLNELAAELLLPQVLHTALEAIVNKALVLNSRPLSLAHLEQKTLTLALSELASPISFIVVDNTILVNALTERSDCTIQTSLRTLKKVKAEQSLTTLIKKGELDVVGDIKVAQQFAALAEQLDIDWQSELAKHIGDVPTHKLLHLGHKITEKVKVTVKQLDSDVSEYVVHEKRLVVTHNQINAFNQGVKQVSSQVEQLSARLNHLAAKLSASSGVSSTTE
jgi:ubiquinone biosynthesis protein UbiJ